MSFPPPPPIAELRRCGSRFPDVSEREIYDYTEQTIRGTNRHLENWVKNSLHLKGWPEIQVFIHVDDLKGNESARNRVIKNIADHYGNAGYIVERKDYGLLISW